LVRKQFKISERFAALQKLSDSEDLSRDWENIKENNKISAKGILGLCELKQHKAWFDEECLDFLEQRKQAKMQWVQNANQSNVDNLNNVRREASRHFRETNKEYLKVKLRKLKLTVR
jgi:hypothetical protein